MQDKNTPLHNLILFLVEEVSKTAKQYSQKEFDRTGLNITIDQWILLKIIDEYQPLSQKELAGKSLRDPASITRTLDILQKKGYVHRVQIPENRRQYNVELSSEGKSFVNSNMDMIGKHRAKSTEGFSDEELAVFKSYLQRMRKNLALD